jgi:K+-transporting ATPase ATPase C chain
MREIIKALRLTLVLWVITAIMYPLAMILIGQVVFPFQANGSLLPNSQSPVGSALIGQPFVSDRYFYSRPSTTAYSTADPNTDKNNVLKTGVSGASNLAPSNPDLLKQVKERASNLQQKGLNPTADLVYASGSSLDPHISIEAANAQAERVARTNILPLDMVQALISKNTERRFLGIFGEPGVNVLKLNLAVDTLKAAAQ